MVGVGDRDLLVSVFLRETKDLVQDAGVEEPELIRDGLAPVDVDGKELQGPLVVLASFFSERLLHHFQDRWLYAYQDILVEATINNLLHHIEAGTGC